MASSASKVERKLTTILAADAAGYSTAMDEDEVGTLEALRASRKVFAKFIERHNGRIANTAGDGLIADFPSVVEAVQCAIEVQQELNGSRGPEGKLHFRIGIHLGDVIVDGNDLLGEGVNLAARLQTMAEPGGILISQQVYDQVHTKLSVGFEYLGEKHPKNFAESVQVYGITVGKGATKSAFGRNAHRKVEIPVGVTPRRHDSDRHASDRHGERPPKEFADREAYRGKVIRHAQTLGIIWIGLLVIDLATGSGFWAQWPAIGMLAAIGFEAAPLCSGDRNRVMIYRAGVVICLLALINLFSWNGTLWFLWPAGAIIVAMLIRRVSARA